MRHGMLLAPLMLCVATLSADPAGGALTEAELIAAPLQQDPTADEMERLRLRLRDAQLELRSAALRREEELRRGLLAVLLLAGSGTALLGYLYRNKIVANRGLKELNARLGQKQEALRAANEQLERLNREMNDVLAVVSHDLKNPLAGIEGLARELRGDDELIDAGQRRIMLEMIEDSARRMFGLVSNLLDLQRIEAGHHGLHARPCDLAAITRVAVQDFQLAARRKSQRIEIEGSPQLWVMGDEAALMRVVNNLVSNALKYAPPCTQVRLILTGGDTPELRVTDQGPGIPPEESARLFRKFSRLSTRPTGGESSSGLGLAIARGIIDALGGRIWCESSVGKGATFCFSLPPATAEKARVN